ncbi:MAG: tetratricopeptide repeat protein [Verrucomicrobiae bacterium]|nr:tetratricopeptide repeat protein [Verrucomicrobiae bacterium]
MIDRGMVKSVDRKPGTSGRWLAMVSGLALLLSGRGESLAQASTDLDLATAYDKAVAAVDAGKYDEGLAAANAIIDEYGSTAMADFGPVFGHFHFIKGILLIKKENYESAIEAFQTCYEKYDNATLKQAVAGEQLMPNRFRVQALAQWAGCEMALGRFEDAAARYQRVLKEDTGQEPRIDRLEIQVNLAKCFLKSGRTEDARKFLVGQLESEALSVRGKRTIFMALVSDWAPLVSTAEVRDFVARHGDLIRKEELISRHGRNPIFAARAVASFKKSEPARALIWYGLMGHPGAVLQHYRDQITELEARVVEPDLKAQVEEKIGELKTKLPALEQEYVSMMLGVAAAHYQLQSLSGSRAAYQLLADNFPAIEQRPLVLHNLVVCSVNLNRWQEAYEYGTTFFREFPGHELKPAVAHVLVEVMFLQGEYAEALRIAGEVREDMEIGSEARDIPDFVAGASLYHLGRFDEAEIEIAAYLENYPDGKRREMVKFYEGATKVNLFRWSEGARSLDGYLSEYPGAAMRATALYLSGLSHLVLEDWDVTLRRIEELHTAYPDAPEIPGSWNVRGDALTGKGDVDFDPISHAHLEAKRLVEEEGRGDVEVAGYALRQLVTAGANYEKWEEAGKWFDEFMAKYETTSWRTDVIVAALEPLTHLGRKDEARALLESLVNEVGDQSGDPRLDELVGAYIDFLRENYDVPEALEKLHQFPADPSPPPAPLRAWLAMGEIQILKGEDAEKHREAINQAYYRLSALQDGGNLSNYTMVQLARWNLEERHKPEEAEKIYDYILMNRPQGEAVGFALVDTGKILAASGTQHDRDEALQRFHRVLNEVDQPELREEATLGIARVLTTEEKWEEAKGWWETYLEDRSHNLARPEANYEYAVCLENTGRRAEAMKAYVNVYVIHAGHLDWSTRAYLRAAEMRKEDGELVDALKILQDMLKRMGHLEHPGIAEGRKKFNDWRDELVAKGGASKP